MKVSKKLISALAVLTLVASCGKDDDKSESKKQKQSDEGREVQEVAAVDGSNIDGHYQAKFITLNPHVNGTIPGSANFYRKEDKLYAYVRLFAGGVRAWHQQFVYTGSRCPTMKDDTNGDGFIDINEAEAVMGKILIPLDSDISSQNAGRRFFPLADLSGYYHYERITSFRRFLSDLQQEDPDPNDDTAKLGPNNGLVITGKTVLILGVSETIELPETVGTKGRHRAFQTLPIACGVFKKVIETPGTPYAQDEIPGPVAEYEEGQDRPADDIPTTGGSTGGSTTGRTTGTNESDDGDGPVSDGNGRTSTTGGSSGETSTTTGGSTTGGSTSGTTGGSTRGSTSGSSSGSTTGSTSSGSSDSSSTTGGMTSGGETTGSSSSDTTTTTTGGSSGSSTTTTSTSTGTTTGDF